MPGETRERADILARARAVLGIAFYRGDADRARSAYVSGYTQAWLHARGDLPPDERLMWATQDALRLYPDEG